MKTQRLAIAITLINLAVLLFSGAQAVRAQGERTPVLRGRALELVDDRGRIRSRINVEPSGEVVLRMHDKNGTIRVKLGAGVDGSGLLLTDEATEPAVHLIARRARTSEKPNTTSITLKGADGRRRVIRP